MHIPTGLKKTAVICVLRHKDKFLLLKRFKAPNQGLYTPVGGKLDPHESPKAAALRETWEETGLKVESMRFCGSLVETSPVDYNWCSFVYITDIDDVTPPDCNEGILEWISFENLLTIPTPKTDWYIYQYLMKNTPFAFSANYNQELELLNMEEEISGKMVYSK